MWSIAMVIMWLILNDLMITFLIFVQGLSLSGGEQEEGQRRLIDGMQSAYPEVSKAYHMCTDTFGAIATACEKGTMSLMHFRNNI